MGLIETNYVPFLLREFLVLDVKQSVCRYDDIAGTRLVDSFLTVVGTVEDSDVERRRKPCELVAPVGNHRCRCHNERGTIFGLVEEERDCLQSLTETHIVSQASSCSPGRYAPHPLIALKLIVAQSGIQRIRHLRLTRRTILDTLAQGLKFLILTYIEIVIVDDIADEPCCRRRHLEVITAVSGDGVEAPKILLSSLLRLIYSLSPTFIYLR